MPEDNAYLVLVRITGCHSAPNPVEDEVRRTLEADGYTCTVVNITPNVKHAKETIRRLVEEN